MKREKRTNLPLAAAVALLFASMLSGCGTAPPDLAENSIPAIHATRYAAPHNAPRLLRTAVQMHRLRSPARHRTLPSVVPQPRALPDQGGLETASLPQPVTAAAAQVRGSMEFEWPVEGKILSRFGRHEGGERNDGINIDAETGTPIHAAAAGDVTYAGKLKGYGNLILIRHRDGYVTAYGHAQAIIVSVGDRVDRGEVIGLSGRTGGVDRPQLHFEIRQGVKPLDPSPLLTASRES